MNIYTYRCSAHLRLVICFTKEERERFSDRAVDIYGNLQMGIVIRAGVDEAASSYTLQDLRCGESRLAIHKSFIGFNDVDFTSQLVEVDSEIKDGYILMRPLKRNRLIPASADALVESEHFTINESSDQEEPITPEDSVAQPAGSDIPPSEAVTNPIGRLTTILSLAKELNRIATADPNIELMIIDRRLSVKCLFTPT